MQKKLLFSITILIFVLVFPILFAVNVNQTVQQQTEGIFSTGYTSPEKLIYSSKELPFSEGALSVWIKPNTNISAYSGKGWDNQIFDYGDSYQKRMSLENYSDGTFGFFSWGQWDINTTTNFWKKDTWYNLVFTQGEGIAKVYVNGTLEKTYTGRNKWFNSIINSEVIIGRSFKGTIDELMLFNKSLTADEVKILYDTINDSKKYASTKLSEYWPFDSTPIIYGWEPINGDWKVLSESKLSQETQSNNASKIKYIGNENICDIVLTFDFVNTSGSFSSTMIYFRTQDEFMKNNYLLFVEKSYLKLGKYVNNAFSIIASAPYQFSLGKKYNLTLIAVGGRLAGAIDDKILIDTNDNTFGCGFIGLGNDNSTMQVSDFSILDPKELIAQNSDENTPNNLQTPAQVLPPKSNSPITNTSYTPPNPILSIFGVIILLLVPIGFILILIYFKKKKEENELAERIEQEKEQEEQIRQIEKRLKTHTVLLNKFIEKYAFPDLDDIVNEITDIRKMIEKNPEIAEDFGKHFLIAQCNAHQNIVQLEKDVRIETNIKFTLVGEEVKNLIDLLQKKYSINIDQKYLEIILSKKALELNNNKFNSIFSNIKPTIAEHIKKYVNYFGEKYLDKVNFLFFISILVKKDLVKAKTVKEYEIFLDNLVNQVIEIVKLEELDFYEKRLSSEITIEDIDIMDGKEFEDFAAKLFQDKGYKVLQTAYSNDQGADLILEKFNKKIVVQAKRYQNLVPNKAIQEVVASKAHYVCDEAWIITNSRLTRPAIALAKSNHVKIIDREELRQML